MTKGVSRIALLSILVLFATIGKGQVLTSCLPNTVDANSTLTLTVTASSSAFMTATGYVPIHTASVVRTAGGTTYTGAWDASSPTTGTLTIDIPPSALGGGYTVRVPNSTGAIIATAGLLTVVALPPPPMGRVTGRVWFDYDNDGVQDAGEPGRPGRIIRFLPAGYYATSNYNGDYSCWLPLGTYTVTEPYMGSYTPSVPASGSHTVNVAVNGATYGGRNFGNYPNPPVTNLSVVTSSSILRPGFNGSVSATVNNTGSLASPATEVTLTWPSWLTYLYSSTAPLSSGPGYATFTVPALNPVGLSPSDASFTVNLNVPAGTSLGTPVSISANSPISDASFSDNSHGHVRNVQGSYDPNDKQVFKASGASAEGYVFPEDSVLRYLIRFQNTGTDTAFTVRIRDTLDLDLDPATFRVLGSSHRHVISMSKTGHLEFVFDNINLLDSNTSEPASHGWILYQIEWDNGLPVGSTMTNRASIYFDFNAPVLTNTTTTVICNHHVASYTVSTPSSLTRDFTSTSVGALTYLWDFGDGSTSTLPNPSHTYAVDGVYNVCFISSNECESDTLCDLITVGCPSATSSFTHSGSLSHSFTSTSVGGIAVYAWTFGDGGTSSAVNPTHVYASPGVYTVCLIVSNDCISDTLCDIIPVSCTAASASFTHLAGGTGSVSFDNTTSGTFTSLWDFGDGGTSTAADPVHVYATPGTYTVCLITTELCGSDTLCDTVSVCAWPLAGFSSIASGFLTHSFTDLSAGGSPSSWVWDFGDGGTSTLASPVHSYAAPGTYTVCLISSNACGIDTLCDTVAVVCDPAVSGFSHSGALSHSFSSTSSGSITSWSWTFGDGGTSTLPNPTHAYAAPGTYTVCLIAGNTCDADTFCDTITLTCLPGTASFATTNLGTGTWFFDNTTSGTVSSFWDFGDGSTSVLADPYHTYSAPGTYTACLINTDICGSDTLCDTISICAWPTSNFGVATTGLTASFSELTVGGTTSWYWDFGDGSSSIATNPSHMYPGPGTYTVCLSASNACGIDMFCLDVTVYCSTVPAAGFLWSDLGMGDVSFSNSSTGLPALTSVWDFGDGGTSTLASPTHTYAASGTYFACLTVTDACGTSTKCDSVAVIISGGSSPLPQGVSLYIFPNPTRDQFVLSGHWPGLNGPISLQVLDATGRRVVTMEAAALNGEISLTTDLSLVAAGLYHVRLLTPLGNITQRVVRQ